MSSSITPIGLTPPTILTDATTPAGTDNPSLEAQQNMAGVLLTLGILDQAPAPRLPPDWTPPLEHSPAAQLLLENRYPEEMRAIGADGGYDQTDDHQRQRLEALLRMSMDAIDPFPLTMAVER